MISELISYELVPASWAVQAGHMRAFAGVDLGRSVHPSHVAAIVRWESRFYQIASCWLDKESYTSQLSYLEKLFARLGVEYALYDNTRSELTVLAERGELPKPMLYGGVVLTLQEKQRLAAQLLISLEKGELILLDDPRQTKSLLQVNALLQSQSVEGVGRADAFTSIGLALEASRRCPITRHFVIPMGPRSDPFRVKRIWY